MKRGDDDERLVKSNDLTASDNMRLIHIHCAPPSAYTHTVTSRYTTTVAFRPMIADFKVSTNPE